MRKYILVSFTFLTPALLLVTGCRITEPEPPGKNFHIEELPSFFREPAWHPQGQWIAVSHGDSVDTNTDGIKDNIFWGIWVIHADTGIKQPLIRGFSYPAWSSDGLKLAMHKMGQIFTVEVLNYDPAEIDMSTLQQLTTKGKNFFPAWSNDGARITYDSDIDDTKYDIWVMDSNGNNKINISSESDSAGEGGWRFPIWSPDDKWIVHGRYMSNGQAGTDVFTMDTNGTNSKWIAHGSFPRYSYDGTKLAFYTEPGLTIWIIEADGTNPRQLTQGPDWDFSWSPDGKSIVFLRWAVNNRNPIPKGNGQLWVIDVDGTNLRQLTFFKGIYGPPLSLGDHLFPSYNLRNNVNK